MHCVTNKSMYRSRLGPLVMRLKPSTPSDMVYGELGQYPTEIDIKSRVVSFRSKILLGKDTKLSAAIFRYMYILSQETTFRSKWLDKIKNILDTCGYSYLWTCQNTTSNLQKIIKERLEDQFRQFWFGKKQTSPKSINYRIYKESLESENYLEYLVIKT